MSERADPSDRHRGPTQSLSGPANDPYVTAPQAALDDLIFLEMVCEIRLTDTTEVIDVGANIGRTVELFSRFTGGRIVALEPSPRAFPHLVRNIETLGRTNVVPVQLAAVAVGSAVGFVDDTITSSASHLVTDQTLAKHRMTEVAAAPLAEIAKDHGIDNPGFIKVDVEGFELDVLLGADAILRRSQPDVFLEFNVFTMMAFRNINPRALLTHVRSQFPHVHWFDGRSIVTIDSDGAATEFLRQTMVHHHGNRDLWCSYGRAL